jgi:hypothetical protein
MWDWLRRSRMGMAEGRFLGINAKTCLQQRQNRAMCGQILSGNTGAIAPSPSAERVTRTHARNPIDGTAQANAVEGLSWMPPCGGLGESRTLRVRILYEEGQQSAQELKSRSRIYTGQSCDAARSVISVAADHENGFSLTCWRFALAPFLLGFPHQVVTPGSGHSLRGRNVLPSCEGSKPEPCQPGERLKREVGDEPSLTVQGVVARYLLRS